MTLFIRHNCGEHKSTVGVGHRWTNHIELLLSGIPALGPACIGIPGLI
jgi:hypothetical protein